MQPDGYVKIKDRSKDIIISGGENISSIEVEDVLYRHPAVMAAAVVAKPDPKWGETPCAFVELKEGAQPTEQEIIEFCREPHGALQGAEGGDFRSLCRKRRPAKSRNSCCASRRNRLRRSIRKTKNASRRLNADKAMKVTIQISTGLLHRVICVYLRLHALDEQRRRIHSRNAQPR